MPLDLSGINNVGEFYSHHYLDALLEGDLKDVFRRWDEAEKEGGARHPSKRLAGLAERYLAARAETEGTRDAAARHERSRDFHAHLLDALGYPYRPDAELLDGDVALPVLLSELREGRPFLWVVDAPFPRGEDQNPFEGAPLPEQLPPGATWAQVPAKTWQELFDTEIFRRESPPRWVMFLAGPDVFLIDRHKWPQGKYLHFDLGELLGRRQPQALKAAAGLLHRDVLAPAGGDCLHDKLDEASHRHAFAVSTDLKYGARRAVELIANEAVWYKREVLKGGVFGDEALARTLTTESLTYLYRLLFLFYVEARGGELSVVPMEADAYRQGYSLESLRDLELVPLTTTEAQDGYYLHHSLTRLFDLVNRGFGHGTERGQLQLADEQPQHDTFMIRGLRSPLFDQARTPLLRSVKLRNQVLQEVLQLLSLSREKGRKSRGNTPRNKGQKSRGRISYAQLGINQLGAVYEGLLSYSGFFAQEDLYEVQPRPKESPREDNDRDGNDDGDEEHPNTRKEKPEDNEDDGDRTWFVPASDIDRYEDEEIVKDENGKPRIHEKGKFIFRLAGRDRQKSASYYTPEVLTRCLTKYTLNERLQGLSADEVLELTLCEPAMGSGAFLNEAINQLADAYLERKQQERGETIPADRYLEERRRVQYHFAVHNVYGVDKNPLAGELARVSLWLNVLQPNVASPYFAARLALGDSLIGARREIFRVADLPRGKDKGALDKAPERVPLGLGRPEDGIYHFLLFDAGMTPFDKDPVVKSLEPDGAQAVKDWRKAISKPHSDMDLQALRRISTRVDALWEEHVKDRSFVLSQMRQPIAIYGRETPSGRWHSVEECEEWHSRLDRPIAPGRRLAAVMDYWCALWFWPVRQAHLLPSRDEWLMEVEALLEGDVEQMAQRSTRLRVAREVAGRLHFHHWEAAFPEAFAERGGFDVILGNPPWIKVEWQEPLVLGDFEPYVAIRGLSAKQCSDIRGAVLKSDAERKVYLGEYETVAGAACFINARQNYPSLYGVQPNLYKCFIERSWGLGSRHGAVGLFHQPGMFDDSRGGAFRAEFAKRGVLVARYQNKLCLFEAVQSTRPYCMTVTRVQPHENVAFQQVCSLLHPKTLDESFEHDGLGPVPGIKDDNDKWDMRGHRSRIVQIDEQAMKLFGELYGSEGDSDFGARIPIVHCQQLLTVLTSLASLRRLRHLSGEFFATPHFHETNQQSDGTLVRKTTFPHRIEDWVVSGPHYFVGSPFYKTPNENCSFHRDYSVIDLSDMSDGYLPRTNLVPAVDDVEWLQRTPKWKDQPVTSLYRHIHRRRLSVTGERTLIGCIIPPGPSHVHTSISACFLSVQNLVLLAAFCHSLLADYFVRSTGKADWDVGDMVQLPFPDANPALASRMTARALRLNCLTRPYADLWATLYDPSYRIDGFTKDDPRLRSWSHLTHEWRRDCALRTPYERHQALVELDALAALAVGLTADELCTVYNLQFPVLRQNERATNYDQRGEIVFTPNVHGLPGVGLSGKQFEEVKHTRAGGTLPDFASAYVHPFDRCDREADMRQAYAHFESILREQP